MRPTLTTTDHDRDVAGLKYVYPVISRRAGGLSIGINFNTNNACNWRCIYCQVPNLIRGSAPELDLELLKQELKVFFQEVLTGDFYDHFQVDTVNRTIKDIAISGNGEPTSVKNFPQALKSIGEIATSLDIFPKAAYVLITNGSLLHQQKVKEGLVTLASYGGEVWFKFDSATKAGRALINETSQSVKSALENMRISSNCCVTKIQTCLFDYAGQGLCDKEKDAYLSALANVKVTTNINQVMLYTLARPSMQPEAQYLTALPKPILEAFAEDIRRLGFAVTVAC